MGVAPMKQRGAKGSPLVYANEEAHNISLRLSPRICQVNEMGRLGERRERESKVESKRELVAANIGQAVTLAGSAEDPPSSTMVWP